MGKKAGQLLTEQQQKEREKIVEFWKCVPLDPKITQV